MADIVKLKAVLASGHPGTGPYHADSTLAAAQGHLVNLTEDVETIDGQALWEAILPADYASLTDRQVTTLWGIIGMESIRVNGPNVRLALANMFASTDTLLILVALQTRAVSHFQKERLGRVYPGHIENARM